MLEFIFVVGHMQPGGLRFDTPGTAVKETRPD